MSKVPTETANRLRFRAWDKRTKDMYLADEPSEADIVLSSKGRIGKVENEMIGCDSVGHYFVEDKDLIPLFSTGLLDKKGKEIFEGDIVRIEDWQGVSEAIVRFGLHEVGFDSDCAKSATGNGFCFEWVRTTVDMLGNNWMDHIGEEWCKSYLGSVLSWGVETEIIGNIYESPELLK